MPMTGAQYGAHYCSANLNTRAPDEFRMQSSQRIRQPSHHLVQKRRGKILDMPSEEDMIT